VDFFAGSWQGAVRSVILPSERIKYFWFEDLKIKLIIAVVVSPSKKVSRGQMCGDDRNKSI
jgi:hypothetical protein